MQKNPPGRYFLAIVFGLLIFVQSLFLVVSKLNLKFTLQTASVEPYIRCFFEGWNVRFARATWIFPYKITFDNVVCVGPKTRGYVLTCEQVECFWVPHRFWEFKVRCAHAKVALPQPNLDAAFACIEIDRALLNVRPVSVCVEKARGRWGTIQWFADKFYYNKRALLQLAAYIQSCMRTDGLPGLAQTTFGCAGGYIGLSGKHVHRVDGCLNQLNLCGGRFDRLAFSLRYGQKFFEGKGYAQAWQGAGFQVPALTFYGHRGSIIAYASELNHEKFSIPQVTLSCKFGPKTGREDTVVELRSQAPFCSTVRLQGRALSGDLEWQQAGLKALCDYAHINLPLTLNGPFRLHFKLNPQREIHYDLEARECVYGGAPWHEVYAAGQYVDGKLTAENIKCRGPGTYLEGCAAYQLSTGHYRFSLKGKIQPLSITSLTPNWWPEVWSNFRFSSWPYTDVDCRASVHDDHITLFGVVACQDFYYKTLPVQQLKMQYTSNAVSTTLDVGGDFNGQLKWAYTPYFADAYELQYKLDGTLPLGPALRALPDTWRRYLLYIDGDARARCSLEGCAFGPRHWNVGSDTMVLAARTDEPFTVCDVPVHAAAVSVRRDGSRWYAQCSHAAIGATGLAFGSLEYKRSERYIRSCSMPILNAHEFSYKRYFREESFYLSPEIALDAHFCRVPLEALSATPWIRDVLKNTDGKTRGFVDGELNIEGPRHLYDLNGTGSWIVREANLGKLHVLGALSSVLEKTFFGLGSFKFTAADAQLRLKRGFLCVPKVRVRGPIAKMEGSGWIDWRTSTVNMGVDVQFLHDVKVPVMKQFFKILNPISRGFHAQLSGSVNEPSWNVSFNPLKGMFQ